MRLREPQTASDVRLDPTLEFLQELWALDHRLQETSKRMARTLRVTGPQRLVLRIVSKNPGIGAGPLARTLHLHPSTLTGVLRRLVADGLLQRLGDPADARRALFMITRPGLTLLERQAGTVEAAVARLLHAQPPAQIAAVRNVLSELCALLGNLSTPS